MPGHGTSTVHTRRGPAEAVAPVRANGPLDGLTKRDRLLVEITRALLRTRRLSDAQYAEAVGADFVASGHYARVGTDAAGGGN